MDFCVNGMGLFDADRIINLVRGDEGTVVKQIKRKWFTALYPCFKV